jgi:hypothetical protein
MKAFGQTGKACQGRGRSLILIDPIRKKKRPALRGVLIFHRMLG